MGDLGSCASMNQSEMSPAELDALRTLVGVLSGGRAMRGPTNSPPRCVPGRTLDSLTRWVLGDAWSANDADYDTHPDEP